MDTSDEPEHLDNDDNESSDHEGSQSNEDDSGPASEDLEINGKKVGAAVVDLTT